MIKILGMFYAIMILSFTSKIPNDQFSSQMCCQNNQIEVIGLGKASALQNMATFVLRFNQNGPTSAAAVKSLSNKVSLALDIFKTQKYSYQSNYMYIYPLYQYTRGKSQIIGQTATLILIIKISEINSNGLNLANIIDSLALINGININSVAMDVNDRQQLKSEARANSYSDAKIRAGDYAALAGLQLVKTIHSQEFFQIYPSLSFENSYFRYQRGFINQLVQLGSLTYQYNTKITFELR